MNKFLSFILFTLLIQYAISETKTKAKSSRAKKEDVDPAIVGSVSYGSTSSEGYNVALDDSTVTPAPVNILNTPTTSSYYKNPLFRSNDGAYNQYNLNSKSYLTNYKVGALNDGSYIPDNYNQYYQNNPYNFNQAKYSSNNYPGHLNYNEDGTYKYDAYSHSLHNSKDPSQYSSVYHQYQPPLSSGYLSGNQGYYNQGLYHGGVNSKENSIKSVGTSSFSSTPAPVTSAISSSSSSSGNVGSGIYTAGSYKSGYNSGYSGLYNNQNKPYSTGGYDFTKNYPGYQSGGYYSQGYSNVGSGIVNPSTSKSSTSSFTSSKSIINSNDSLTGDIKTNLQGQYKPVSPSSLYPGQVNYPGYSNYQTGTYDSGAYNYQGYDYSKFNNPSYQFNKASEVKYTPTYNSNIFPKTTTATKSVQSSSGVLSSGVSSVNSAGLSSIGQVKPVVPVGSYSYPGYTNYQAGAYDYNAYPGYAGYNYQGNQLNKASAFTPGYNAYGSVTSAPVTSTSYPSISSGLKSTVTPSVTKNKISSTVISSTTPSYNAGQYQYQSGYLGNQYGYSGYPGYQSGYYEDGSYKQNYNTNQYSNKGSFYQNSGAFGQGYKYPNVLTGTSSPVTPLVSSGIGSSTASYSDLKNFNKVNSGSIGTSPVNGNVQSSYSGSYDFSSYGKKNPSIISTTISSINPSYYNYPDYQKYLSGNTGYYQQSGINYPGYNIAGYHESGYRTGSLIPNNVTGTNYYLGSFAQDGIYNPSYKTQHLSSSGYVNGINPADYQTGQYHSGKYVQDGFYHTFPGALPSHLTSEYHEGFPTTVSPVTSTETATTK